MKIIQTLLFTMLNLCTGSNSSHVSSQLAGYPKKSLHSIVLIFTVLLTLFSNDLMATAEVNLDTPLDSKGEADLTPTFKWNSSGTGTLDNILYIDTDPDVFTGGSSYDVNTATTHTLVSDLTAGTIYYWGVAVTDPYSSTTQSVVRTFMPLNPNQAGSLGGATVINATADANNLYFADVDGDGDMDIVTISNGDNEMAWWSNDGSESFTKNTISSSPAFSEPMDVTVFDMNGDGDMDIMVADQTGAGSISYWDNNGSESFTQSALGATWRSTGLHFGDMDGDGDMDFINIAQSDGDIFWFENDGAESFTEYTIDALFGNSNNTQIYMVDLDNDGDMDVVGAESSSNEIQWYENDGSQSFTKNTVDASLTNAYGLDIVDLDSDGDLDILGVGSAGTGIFWYNNNGSESFTETQIGTSTGFIKRVSSLDVDGDGDMDVVTTTGGDMYLLTNDGSESFTETTFSTSESNVYDLMTVDLDGDGDMDVIATDATTEDITWYQNVITLPVELIYFDVMRTGSYVLLEWETLAEINNDHFIVLKSSDGENWEEILTVQGQGNTNDQTYYSQIDVNGCDGVCYYKLIQVDFGGHREEEGVRVLNSNNENLEFKISVIPNPINTIANISFSTPESGIFNLIILNQQGQMVYSAKTIEEKGNNHLSFKSSVLAHGSYYFILEDENGNRSQQLVIK